MDLSIIDLEKYMWRIPFYSVNCPENLLQIYKKNNDFGYILPNSCFAEQLSMPAKSNACKNQNLKVKVKWNVFIFFFRLKSFSLLLCSTLPSSCLLSRHKCSHRRCFISIERAVLKKIATFTRKHLRRSQTCRFIKKRLQHRCFYKNISKF